MLPFGSYLNRPGGNPGKNLKSISHRCYLFEVEFVWELTKETIVFPLGCLQGGSSDFAGLACPESGDLADVQRETVGLWGGGVL